MSATNKNPEVGSRGNRVAASVLVVLATILSIISVYAVWVDQQVLNPDNWADTSTKLLQNKEVRTQTAVFITDKIYENVDVQAEIEKALPTDASILAGPAADALRGLAQTGIEKSLGTSEAQSVWKSAHRALDQQVVDVINQTNTGFLQYQGDNVQLDLREAAIKIGDRLGLKSQAEKIKPGQATLTIFSSSDIGQFRTVARFLQGLAVIGPLLAFLFFSLAVAVNRGRRRRTVVISAAALILAALIALAAKGVAETPVVDALATTDAAKPAAKATWEIATGMLNSIATSTIWLAVLVLIFSTLGGPWKFAVTFRRWVAPWVNQRPAIAFGVAYSLFLLFLIWGPVPAFRQWVTVAIFLVLVGLAVWALRRETLVEFPEASSDDAVEKLKEAWTELKETLGSGISKGAEGASSAAKQVRDKATTSTGSDHPTKVDNSDAPTASQTPEPGVDGLERLAALHASGALTAEEFAAAKAKLL
ncbi:MAG: SHOCT domain-containing protein [Solirubrobacterales bacterium]|nr:SHOCT domain-containing protein [Solirubrobacterales bacterium]